MAGWFLHELDRPHAGWSGEKVDILLEPGGTAMTQGFHRWDHPVRIDQYQAHGHVHLHAMSMQAIYPDGRQEILLNVPKYDFDWQLFYYLEEPKRLPAGTELEIVARYDNSADNVDNPDPNRDVGFGLQSTDEMMFGVFEMIEVDQSTPAEAPSGAE